MSFVGWDAICQPKDYGGLGMRQLRDQNITFLLKLGYRVISDKEAFWARVVRSKYGLDGLDGSLPDSIARDRSSFFFCSCSQKFGFSFVKISYGLLATCVKFVVGRTLGFPTLVLWLISSLHLLILILIAYSVIWS